jgi:hypothetical protein
MPGVPPPRPIPIRERSSILFVEKGLLDVLDGGFVVVDENYIRTHIPISGLVCLMLEPGTHQNHPSLSAPQTRWAGLPATGEHIATASAQNRRVLFTTSPTS